MYLHNCDLGYRFFLHSSRLYHIDFSKKEDESAADLNIRVTFFLKLADGLSRSDFDSVVLHICGTSVHCNVASIFFDACRVLIL